MKKLASVVFVVACGGGSGGSFGTGPITQSQADELCTEECQYNIDCGTELDPLATCVADCAAEVVGWVRADAFETILDCQTALACNASDDECVALVSPLAIHDQWETECRAQLAECAPSPEDLNGICAVRPDPNDDDIGFVRFIAPPIVEEMLTCLDEAVCDSRVTCLQAVFEANGVDF